MKRLLFAAVTVATVLLSLLYSSCDNQDVFKREGIESELLLNLKAFGSVHNEGLDYIKADMSEADGTNTYKRLDSAFEHYVVYKCGIKEGTATSGELREFKVRLFNGEIPSLHRVRSGEFDDLLTQANPLALNALIECMAQIRARLSQVSEDSLFDNPTLLAELHSIVCAVYSDYLTSPCDDKDEKALELTLGVLCGSLEYWAASENVIQWSNLDVTNENVDSEIQSNSTRADNNTPEGGMITNPETKEEKTVLTKTEFISTMAAADAIGGLLGGPAAVIASAIAALSFEVE